MRGARRVRPTIEFLLALWRGWRSLECVVQPRVGVQVHVALSLATSCQFRPTVLGPRPTCIGQVALLRRVDRDLIAS